MAEAQPSGHSAADFAVLLDELRAHQIELEMQNEQLRRAQLELEVERAKYTELFDHAPVGYVTLTEQGLVADANLTAARLLGVERQRLLGRQFTSFVAAVDQDVYHLHHTQSELDEESFTCEVRLLRAGSQPGGEAEAGPFWTHLEERPRVVGGKRLGYGVTFGDFDATVQEAAEIQRLNAELRQAQELLRETQAISELGGWEYDVATRRFTWTDEMRTIFGVGPDHDPNDAGSDGGAYTPQSETARAEAFRGAIEEAEPYDLELELERADGSRIWVRSLARPVLLNGEVVHVVGSTMDITARKRAEEALRRRTEDVERQQAFLATLLDTIPSPVFYKDTAGIYLGCNKAFEVLIGRERGEIVGKTALDIGPPELAEMYEMMDRRLLEEASPQTYEWPIRAADGFARDVVFNKAPFMGADGQVAGLVGVILDITERKRTEEALRESEERLQRLFETMNEGVVLIAADGHIVSANRAAAEILGLSRSQIEGRPYGSPQWTLLRPDGTPMPPEEMASPRGIMEGRAVSDVVMGLVRADGSVSWISINAAPLLDGKGKVEGVVCTFTDITARQKVEEALRRSEAGLAEAQRIAHVGSWDWDLAANTITWSDEMYRLFGISPDAYDGSPEAVLGVVHPDDRESFVKNMEDNLARAVSRPLEYRVIHPDGAERTLFAAGNIVCDEAGAPVRNIGTVQDVTERRRLEADLRASAANFRSFFETADDIILVASLEGRIIHANPALSARLGYSAEEIAGLHVLDLNPSERRAEAEAILAAMLRGERDTCSLPLQARSGALLPAETRVWLGRWDGAVCIFAVCKDLTAEQEALQKFDRLFNANPAPMAVSDVPEGRFTEVNEAFLSLLGYSREEIIGRTNAELGIAVHPERQQELAQQLRAQGHLRNSELQVRCKDGTILDGLFSGEIIESRGRPYLLTVMIDQTGLRRASEEPPASG